MRLAGVVERKSQPGAGSDVVQDRRRACSFGAGVVPAEERPELIAEYKERFANPYSAAERGYVDDVIEPRRTRPVLIDALKTTLDKAEPRPRRKHGNIPL